MVFNVDKVYLCPHPGFLKKVVSMLTQQFFFNQPFWRLAVIRGRKDWTLRTLECQSFSIWIRLNLSDFHHNWLFHLWTEWGADLFPHKWFHYGISSCFCLGSHLTNVKPPDRVLSHSTRSQATSAAFLASMPILDVCKATTWSLCHVCLSLCYLSTIWRLC